MPDSDARPLDGLKVLDFSRVLAGPLCTQSLADLGADVIKIEPIGAGDETRGWPPIHGEGFGAVFLAVNRNKRSLAVDLKTAAGRALVHRLARDCDIAVENFSTGVAERLEIDAATLQAINPRLIHCAISGYGRTGPLKNGAGYDVILQAFSGIMSLTGEPDGGHIRSPFSPIDQVTGIHAFSGILAALLQRAKTGRGSTVDVSLLDTAISLLNTSLQSYWKSGVQPGRAGSSHDGLCPYQAFDAADGPVMIGIANDNLWRKFCPVAGLDDIVDDARFRRNVDRVAHRATLVAIVAEAIARQPVAFWTDQLSAIGVPVAPINNLPQMLDHPQTHDRALIVKSDIRSGESVKGIAYPVRLDGRLMPVDRAPPALGENGDAVLAEFGFTVGDIAALRAEGAIGDSQGNEQ